MANIPLSACTVRHGPDAAGLVHVWIKTAATVDAADVITPITLADYGIKELLAVHSFVQTTEDSVVTEEANTTAVAAGVLSVTIAAGTDDDTRIIHVIGEA